MLRCVLWDFGDTLVDESWMLEAPDGVPAWTAVWSDVARGPREDAWNRGDVTEDEIIEAVASRLPMTAEQVRAHARRCCARIRFFETPWALARSLRLPQALVTVNPDGFSNWVVPEHRLDEVFDLIVASWEERILDKAELCQIALDRLGGAVDPSDALLIDNKEANVEAWMARGGRGYWFRGDAAFRADLGSELEELARAAGTAA